MKNRARNYYRIQRKRHINRKKRIIKGLNDYWVYKHEGMLSKGKIHCSCYMCAGKTNWHGYKPSDLRKLEAINQELREYKAGSDDHITPIKVRRRSV